MGFAKVIAAMLTLPDAVLGKNIGMAQVTKKNKVHRLSRRVSNVVLGCFKRPPFDICFFLTV